MSRLVMWNLVTVDGAFREANPWQHSFFESVLGPEFESISAEMLGTADRLMFGRLTYEGMAAYWPTATGIIADWMNRLPKFVFTHGTRVAPWANVTVISDDAIGTVRKLKQQGNGTSLVFGSGNLSKGLIEHDLFDEYRLIVTPVIVSNGVPLFAGLSRPRKLRLLDARTLASGGVILRYEPAGTDSSQVA